jgi:hypothetical protein
MLSLPPPRAVPKHSFENDANVRSAIDAPYRSGRYLDATNLVALSSVVNVDLRVSAETGKCGVTLFVTNLAYNGALTAGRRPRLLCISNDWFVRLDAGPELVSPGET